MRKTLKFDFYVVEIPDTIRRPFHSLLDSIAQMNPPERRNEALGGAPVRLQELHTAEDMREGDMIRIRMDDLPSCASMRGPVRDLPLAADEGVGEQTAFLYHIPTSVLVLQSTKVGASASRIADYIERKLNLPPGISIDPLLSRDALARMQRMMVVRKLHLRAARVTNPQFIALGNPGVSRFIREVSVGVAPTVELSISLGHARRGSLARDRVFGLARSWARSVAGRPAEVKSIEVCGVDRDGETSAVDLIEDRMREPIALDTRAGRRASYEFRRGAAAAAWARRRGEVLEVREAEGDGDNG
jgi:hypothetical protein